MNDFKQLDGISTFNFHRPDSADAETPVRTVLIDGAPWFVARDVAVVLELSHMREALRALDDDEKDSVRVPDAIGRNRMTPVVSESGLYALIVRSNKPSAKVFRKWITGTVLPTIRKTGSYIIGEERLDPASPEYAAQVSALSLASLQQKLEAAQTENATLKPKAEAYLIIAEADGDLLVREVAKVLQSTQTKLFGWMETRGWVTKETSRGRKQRQATAQATARGYMTTKVYVDTRGNARTTPLVTPKGLAHLAKIKNQSLTKLAMAA